MDDQGFAYVTGSSAGYGSASDYATIKYSPDGDRLWVHRYNGPTSDSDNANAIALDSGRNVYVTGDSMGHGAGANYATIRYSPEGDRLWVRRYGPASNWSLGRAITVDRLYNVYVVGSSRGAEADDDFVIIKYKQVP